MDETKPEPHRRRKRYAGTHPRSFRDKYKELNPDRYVADLAKVIARGDTPAGTHRPICVKEIMEVLSPVPGVIAVDATLGYGGHARKILDAIAPGGRLFGLDQDPLELPKTESRLRSEGFGEKVFITRALNFSDLPRLLAEEGLPGVDIILADLGISSMQIDDPSRGFTYKRNGPLDMRMNPGKGTSAAEFLKRTSTEKLRTVLEKNADEPAAAAISEAIARHKGTITTTRALSDAIRSAFPDRANNDPETIKALQRTFQALRIEVNGEFAALDSLLASLPDCLNPSGRVAILTFHSGEDGRVEKSFLQGLQMGLYSSISMDAIRPGREERYSNPRSTSARLRWAVRA
ncbi:MAG: 16S rRNA (cytosine(1402)-N(4))-methyltransferase RsmH [Rectinemataceae bacterium]|nr:16S rRNA (cytosine(1402)-N(4))-methyltransferase RsmH [Rectinemataceae bacterium]